MTPHQYLSQAISRWPAFGVEHVFLARLNSGILDPGADDAFAAEDFYLACAALKGAALAVREVEQLLDAQLGTLGHFRLSPTELDDIRAALFSSLLVAPAGEKPRLLRYSGRGPLAGWLKVVCTREALSWLRRHQRQVTADDEALLGSVDAADSPELSFLKERYRGEFSAAFCRAMSALSPRQRNLLRQHYLDELSLEDVAALYGVHRATAARWLASARLELLSRTREEMTRVLGISAAEADSLMKLLQSRLDLSAGIFLSAQRSKEKPG